MATTFPAHVLGIKVELLLNGVWTDISLYVQQRNVITISGIGRPDWTSTMQASQMTLTLNNRDGRFTPKLAGKAYYPYITRNVKIRLSVDSLSMTSVAYTGYRFWGEVTTWPVKWDVTGTDIYSDIVCSGIWLRMSQSKIPIGSPFLRYNQNLTGTSVPRAYLPMEDGSGSLTLVPVSASTSNATFTGSPSLGSNVNFRGSDGIVTLNAGTITCPVPAGGTPTNNVIRFLVSIPAAGDSNQGVNQWCIMEADTASAALPCLEVYISSYPASLGKLIFMARSAPVSGTIRFQTTTTTDVRGVPLLVSVELTPSGSNVAWALRLIRQGDGSILESKTGTYTTATIGTVSQVIFGRAGQLMDTAVGHLSVTYAAVPSLVTAAGALGGYAGEYALDRFTRVCAEEGIATEVIGTAATSAAMGPQQNMTITQLLQTIEDTDCGMLYEARTSFALGYRTLKSMADQAAALTLNYAAATLSGELSPIYDFQLTKNNITCTNWDGYTAQSYLSAGAMSILEPPNGIGSGYEYTRNVNCSLDSQVGPIATWLLNVGSVDENRFPGVTLDMRRSELVALFAAIPAVRPGDFIAITSPPSFISAGTINQLALGYSETLNAFEWTISFNTAPESPYVTGFTPGTIQTHQLPGGTSVSSQGDFVKSIAALIANGNITPAMLNTGITSVSLDGIRTTIAVAAPTDPNPNNGDIWINSTTGQLSRFNGATWDAITFDAGNVIQAASIESAQIAANTIVAGNIAGGTITAGLLAAGIVVAGIVDATSIKADNYIATSAAGEFLAYDTNPGSTGHLVNSIAGAAGTDAVSNPFPKGLMGQGLTLLNQSSAPAAFSGASILYSSSGGRARLKSSSGSDVVMDRSWLDLANYSFTVSSDPRIMSSTLHYLAGEAIVGSEYEIEIDGTVTTPATTPQVFNFNLFLDGVAIGASSGVAIGTVMMLAGQTFGYCLRYRITIDTAGAGGSGTVACDGGIGRQGVNFGNVQAGGGLTATPINHLEVNCAIDTTSNHDLAIYCNWSSAPATGSAITYRTKLTRRN